jgi:hypothetical protein
VSGQGAARLTLGLAFLLLSRGFREREAAGGCDQWRVPAIQAGGRCGVLAILTRVVQLGRGRRASDAASQAPDAGHERRIEVLEGRVDQLEALLEGLQDAVHRESVREGGRIEALEKRSEPSEISRALSRDARERGL